MFHRPIINSAFRCPHIDFFPLLIEIDCRLRSSILAYSFAQEWVTSAVDETMTHNIIKIRRSSIGFTLGVAKVEIHLCTWSIPAIYFLMTWLMACSMLKPIHTSHVAVIGCSSWNFLWKFVCQEITFQLQKVSTDVGLKC